MDQIDDDFTAIMEDTDNKWHPSIPAAVGLAKKTLNKYYSLTDSSENYRIAISMIFGFLLLDFINPLTVLHPKLKMKYFTKQKWEQEWITEAQRLFTEQFHESYAGRFGSMETSAETASSCAPSEVCGLWLSFADHPFANKLVTNLLKTG
jgi:hypothetical protein